MKRNMFRHVVIQPPDQNIRLIALTQNQNTIVDAADYDWLNQWNWLALWTPCTRSFYAMRGPGIVMSRIILNAPADLQVDHINRDTLDNRRSNLRLATLSQNRSNTKKRSHNKSGYKGVCWHKAANKWVAQIKVNGHVLHIGCYDLPEDAARAYDEVAEMLHGRFALLNSINQ